MRYLKGKHAIDVDLPVLGSVDNYSQELLCCKKSAYILFFSDEIYDKILYDAAEHHSIAALASDLLTVTFNGLSKTRR
ncbi:hypothetical protein CE195_10775 [Sodalis-like symbiont of Philaenus spumarius]|nr:hypothetical protein CE195_10775 [Sodalis-like symbiont of Philaenus spumarius]